MAGVEIKKDIKTANDKLYKSNLKLGNKTVNPVINNKNVIAYLGNKPIVTTYNSTNSLKLEIDNWVGSGVGDATGTHVFINGVSQVTRSVIDGKVVGTDTTCFTSNTHNVILYCGSVRGCWFYSTNGNVPVYDRLSNNLTLNIYNTQTDNKLYIGFGSNEINGNETFTYIANGTNYTNSGESDEIIIYENENDVLSSRDRMMCTLKLFKNIYTDNSNSNHGFKMIDANLIGVATGSNHIRGIGSRGTQFDIVILKTHIPMTQVGINFHSYPSQNETFTVSSNVCDGGEPGADNISISPSPFRMNDNITVRVS